MNAKALTITLIPLVCVASAVAGDVHGEGSPTGRNPVVTVGEITPVQAQPGDTVEVPVRVTVAPGHHIQANPASNEFLVPMELSFDTACGVSVVSVAYPEASRYRLEGADEDLLTCHGTVVVTVRVAVAAASAPGECELAGTLSYQACTSRFCLFPASVPVVIPVEVHA